MHENYLHPIARNLIQPDEEIFRIFYYDAPPFSGTLTNPINQQSSDYSQLLTFSAASSFQKNLAEKDLLALRAGKLAFEGWKISDGFMKKIKTGFIPQNISPSDLKPSFKQKAVDIKIGLDIASLAIKRLVDKIVLITADTDFIPAMKLARREGLRITIVKIDHHISSDLKQHADEVIDFDWAKIT